MKNRIIAFVLSVFTIAFIVGLFFLICAYPKSIYLFIAFGLSYLLYATYTNYLEWIEGEEEEIEEATQNHLETKSVFKQTRKIGEGLKNAESDEHIDPKSVAICKYCGNNFVRTHLLQQYCPSKYGKKNYCKYQKKLLRSSKYKK